jgi:imidazolonepropionase-like amidohydrolase
MIRVSTRLVAVAAGTLLVAAFSFPPSLAQAPSGNTVALTGARVIDGAGGAAIERGAVVISNGLVEAVGPETSVKIPAGTTRIDVSGKTIIPGLIDSHAHLNVEQGATVPVRDDLVRRLRMYAMYGVTSAVSLGSTQADEMEGLKLRDEQSGAQARGTLDRARLYTAALNAIGKTPEEARKSVDRLADLKADIIKYHINGTPNDMTPDIYGAIVDEAHKRGLRAAVHVFYLKDAQGALDKGSDILAHSVRDQDVPPAFVAELKRKNVGYIPTLTRDLSVFVYETTPAFFKDAFFLRGISLYRDHVNQLSDPARQEKVRNDKNAQAIKPALEQANRNLKILSDAGVPTAMGTDSGVAGAGNLGRWQGYFEHVEMEMMVKAGMTPMQVIVAATGGGAKIMKVDAKIGTLQPGNYADLVVLNANPLTDIRNTQKIDSVWMAGHKLTMNTMKTN